MIHSAHFSKPSSAWEAEIYKPINRALVFWLGSVIIAPHQELEEEIMKNEVRGIRNSSLAKVLKQFRAL